MNTYKSPITYHEKWITNPDKAFEYFMALEWDNRTSARQEIFFATVTDPYTYGTGEFARTYVPRPMDKKVFEIGEEIAEACNFLDYELCFMNRYTNEKQQLGWHADDAESIDHTRPIAVVSLGAERELWIKPIGGTHEDVEKVKLAHGSLLLMRPGMQFTHYHRIPKHDRPCTDRISLTYRGFKHATQ